MPVSFLGLVLDRAGGRQLAVHFWSCDYIRSWKHRDGNLKAIQPVADRTKSLTVHITGPNSYWERIYLLDLFAIPHQNLETLDFSFNAFYASSPRSYQAPLASLYRPDVSDAKETIIAQLFTLIPVGQLKHLTLRQMKGWPPTRFGNLTDLTLFGYADGTALAEAVPANPALRKLKLESIKDEERYSWDSSRLVHLDGQTLELVRCDSAVLGMFSLSSTCSLVITTTMTRTINWRGELLGRKWLPRDISTLRCLHELEEVHSSITKIPRRRGWFAVEQKTVGHSTSKSTPGTRSEPSLVFTLKYFYKREAYAVRLLPQCLLPNPIPWARVTHVSLDGFHDQSGIDGNATLRTLSNARSLLLRRCGRGIVPLITPRELRSLESLRFEDDLSGTDLGGALLTALESRHLSSGLRLKDLIIVKSGGLSTITVEQIAKLKELVDHIEVTTPGYRSVPV